MEVAVGRRGTSRCRSPGGPRGRSPDRRPPRPGASARPRPTATARPRSSPRRRPRPRARSPRSRRSRAPARRRRGRPGSPAPAPTPRCRGPSRRGRWASSMVVMPDTWMRAGGLAAGCAPRPRRPASAHQRSSSAGADRTAAWSSPSRSTASSVPNKGMPRMKLWVPSIGSMYQRIDASAASLPYSSPMRPWSGNASSEPSRIIRSISVSAWVTNDLSGLVEIWRSRRKCRRATTSASSQAASATSSQPRSSASVPRRNAGRPVRRRRPHRRVAHARILAPSGSYSGSRATSKPIQSPKTSTSPRVPMAARSGGR